jgi:hypothetical protein
VGIHESYTLTTIEIAQLKADERAYVLVEQARLRCERFQHGVSTDAERLVLERIHRELGMAGWLVSSRLDPVRRLSHLAAAHRHAMTPTLHTTDAHALAAVVIEGEDAVVAALTRDPGSDHMHVAHLHLLCAMELLAAFHTAVRRAGDHGGSTSGGPPRSRAVRRAEIEGTPPRGS